MTVRRRKPSALARMRRFWMPVALAGGVVAVGLTLAAMWPGFTVKAVEVVGNDRVSTQDILTRANISSRQSIWLQNTGAMANRIEAIPYVGNVSIRRLPPSTIRITIRERVPFATLRSPPASVIVDRDLRVLANGAVEQKPVLTVRPGLALNIGAFVTAHEAVGLRDAYDALRAHHVDARTLAWDRYAGLVVTLPDGLTLLLGPENNLSQKLTLVEAILTQIVRNQHQRRVAAIDVRAPGTPVVVYR